MAKQVFFSVSDWPQGLSDSNHYAVVITPAGILTECLLVGALTEVRDENDVVIGWSGECASEGCAIPATFTAAQSIFTRLATELSYTVDATTERSAYNAARPAKAPRTFSKLKLVSALTQMGKWAEAKSWIESNGLYDMYLAAQVVREDNEYFTQGISAVQSALGMTDEQVETILAQCVAE